MSKWYEPEKDDMSIDEDKNEVNILVTNDDSGNIYAVLTFDQIKYIYGELLCNLLKQR